MNFRPKSLFLLVVLTLCPLAVLGQSDCNELLKKMAKPHPNLESPCCLEPQYGWLKKANKNAKYYRIIVVQFRPQELNSQFALYVDGSSAAYHGNDLASMVQSLNQISPLPKGGSYYFSLDGFDGPHANNLANTLRLQQDSVDPSVSIKEVSGDPSRWSDTIIAKVVEVRGQPQIRPLEGRPGWYEGTMTVVQRFKDQLQEGLLRVQAKSRPLLESFFGLFGRRVGHSLTSGSPQSLAEITSFTRAALKRTFTFDDSELRTMMVDQTRNIFIVELSKYFYVG